MVPAPPLKPSSRPAANDSQGGDDSERRVVDAIVIGGSAGSVTALLAILPPLPASFPPVLIVVHVLASSPSLLTQVFAPVCTMHVSEPEGGEAIAPGVIYFAPADYHLLVEPDRRCSLSIEPPVHYSRPAIDVLFETAARAYGPGLVGVVLTGASRDGADGLAAIKKAGGRAIVQEPASSEVRVMPAAALAAVPDARVVPLHQISKELLSLVRSP
jgi:two-component system chemotaxis response regulator CheB